VRVFKTRWLARFARRERIADMSLSQAIRRAEWGLIDADLGGGLNQTARRSQGTRSIGRLSDDGRLPRQRPGGVPLFAKNERDNIDPDELLSLREIAERWLAADEGMIARGITDGALQEIDDDDEA
jgi:hypothetical protein